MGLKSRLESRYGLEDSCFAGGELSRFATEWALVFRWPTCLPKSRIRI
jgi:hypothetical protein